MWGRRRRLRQAMLQADGERHPDPSLEREVRKFQDLSRLVRRAATPEEAHIPPFGAFWSGVEQRIGASKTSREAEVSGLRALLGRRLLLAPVGIVVLAAVIGVLWWVRPEVQNNQCFVDLYQIESGTIVIEQDLDRPDRPTVIWHDSQSEG